MRKNKPKHILVQQQDAFLKTCPICGNRTTYIKGTNIIHCDHINTEHSDKPLYYRLLNERGQAIAHELFGE